jgi:N utilization substance protein B
MITRRESRAIALQTLFNLDFKDKENYKESYEYTLSDFFDAKEDDGKEIERIKKDEYSYNLVEKIIEKKDILDEIIKKAAPEWPLNKIPLVERNILRIGIYELLFGEEKIPAPVAVNESIVLSKLFNIKEGSDNFIAGVLGSVLEASGIDEDESRK